MVCMIRVAAVDDHPLSRRPVFYAVYAIDVAGNVSPPGRVRIPLFDPPLRTPFDRAGVHGMGSTATQRNAMSADIYSFLLWQMGKATLKG